MRFLGTASQLPQSRMERRIVEQEAEDEEATIAQHDLLNSEIEPIAFSPRITSQ